MSNSIPPPSFLGHAWPFLQRFLIIFGIPATAAAAYFSKNPLLAIGIGLLYEAAVFVFGFLGKVWGKLQDPWAERSANWFDRKVQRLFSRYQHRYYQYLYYLHRDFDVKGLSTLGPHALELDQVFIELSVDTIAPSKVTANPVQLPQTFLDKSHVIWDYLASPLNMQHLAIIGPPGSGKTTLLKHIVLTLVAQMKYYPRSLRVKIPRKVPILLFLRDHIQAIVEQREQREQQEQQTFSLVDAIHDHLKKWGQPQPPIEWFQRHLNKGRCLIMLDGLDEVADPTKRRIVMGWVEKQMVANHQNCFIVTSRPGGYRRNPISSMTVLEVRPFTREQVEHFIHKWYLANEIMSKQKDDPGVHMRARTEAIALLQKLRTEPALYALTVNPLLLTMIATVHRYGGELPGNRMTLYSEICEVFLGKRQLARGQALELMPTQMQLVLEPLAYYMMTNEIRDIERDAVLLVIEEPLRWVIKSISVDMFLEMTEQVSGLLLERESGVYSFAHQTFQEYLAASYIKEKQLGYMLIGLIENAWWRETILLYSAMMDATPIISACLESVQSSPTALELAIACDQEARKVQPEVRARLEKLLKEDVENVNSERKHLVAEALLSRRLRNLLYLKEKTYIDTSLITNAEYQVFLDEKLTRGYSLLPDHWTSYHFPHGKGNEPVLGVRSSNAQAFCAWLTEREAGPWRYRLPEVGELEGENISLDLPDKIGYWLNEGEGFSWANNSVLIPDTLLREAFTTIHSEPALSSRTLLLDLDHTLVCLASIDHMLAPTLTAALNRHMEAPTDLSAIDLANILELTSNHNSTLSLSLPLFRASGLARTLSSDLAHANEVTRARALANELTHASILARTLAKNFGSDQDPNYFAGADDLVHTLELTSAISTQLASANSTKLIHTFAQIINQMLTTDFTNTIANEIAVALLLDVTSHQSQSFHQNDQEQAVSLRQRKKMDWPIQRITDDLLDIFLDITILEKRIQGELPACEGILLVKERT